MKEKMRGKTIRWVLLFFAIMIVFTILSRVIYEMCVIQVQVDTTVPGEIAQTIESTGKIEGKGEAIITSVEGLLVAEVCVKQGQEVKQGDILYKIDTGDIQELIQNVSSEVEGLKLQLQVLQSQQEQIGKEHALGRSQAEENYQKTLEGAEIAIENARQQITATRQKQVEQENLLIQKQEEYQSLLDAGEQDKATEMEIKIQEIKQQIQAFQDMAVESEAVLSQVQIEQEAAIRAARQELERQNLGMAQDTGVQQLQLQIDAGEFKLQKLKDFQNIPEIRAPYDAFVKEILINTGSRTANSADMVLLNASQGLVAVSVFTQEGKENLKEGIPVEITFSGQKTVLDTENGEENLEYPITSVIRVGEELENVEVRVDLPYQEQLMGRMVNITLKTEARYYPAVIDRRALHLDGEEEYFVYVVKERETVMGIETRAVRRDVEVLDKNEDRVAIEGIGKNEQVIIDSSRYVQEEDRIKINEDR